MAESNSIPSVAHLRECFDLIDGVLIWRARPAHHFPDQRVCRAINSRNAGTVAGSIRKDGYLAVGVGKEKKQLAHRVVFALTHGRWPEGIIDHIDGNKLNNKPENLREATHSKNAANAPAMSHNACGFKGVHLQRQTGRWRAQMKLNKKTLHLGYFAAAELAAQAYEAAAFAAFGEFAYSARQPGAAHNR